jgi:hypothetical protein
VATAAGPTRPGCEWCRKIHNGRSASLAVPRSRPARRQAAYVFYGTPRNQVCCDQLPPNCCNGTRSSNYHDILRCGPQSLPWVTPAVVTAPVATALESSMRGLFARAPAVQQERNLEALCGYDGSILICAEDSLLEDADDPVDAIHHDAGRIGRCRARRRLSVSRCFARC